MTWAFWAAIDPESIWLAGLAAAGVTAEPMVAAVSATPATKPAAVRASLLRSIFSSPQRARPTYRGGSRNVRRNVGDDSGTKCLVQYASRTTASAPSTGSGLDAP